MPPNNPQTAPAPESAAPEAERHVVLVAPDVHWNTGNIGRTCLGAGARLHLIRPLGFSLDHRHIKRAGLDYWPQVRLSIWNHVDAFLESTNPRPEEIRLFSKNGAQSYWSMPALERMFLIFGSETRGLPADLRARFPDALYHIPTSGAIRSLNLSTAVGIVLYESLRKMPPHHAWPP
ncbi:MAG: tRNA (cytidine(34)-2'-O)-methyltransferase [Desulfosarcina sp.]|nr:tRNA (cytidine(34)-2'-O)-methyltransferase [Desulfobacterales bacterium]